MESGRYWQLLFVCRSWALLFLGGVSKDPFKGVALHSIRVINLHGELRSSKVEA